MNWDTLYNDFSNGKPDAIQAVFSILGFIVTIIGTIYVVVTFRQQKRINIEQQELNRISLEKDRREIFPWFTGKKKNVGPIADGQMENYEIILHGNKARDVEIFPVDINLKHSAPIYFPSQVASPSNENVYDTLRIRNRGRNNMGEWDLQYLIYYTDEVGRPYTQDVGYDGKKVIILYPQQVAKGFRKKLPIKTWVIDH